MSAHPPPPKTVIVFRNGDAFYPGRKFVINQRQSYTFESFLNTVTRGITAHFGAVRNIYTTNKGHRVTNLEKLVHGEIYVAAGAEGLKQMDYRHITTQKPPKKKSEPIQPVVHSRIIVPARWKRISNESCIINVFTNGDILVPPARVLIPKHTLGSWENVLAMVTERVHLRTGAVHRLCMLNGKPVRGSYDLQNNHYYVAVGTERFRALPYHLAPSKGVIHNITDVVNNGIHPVLKKEKEDRTLFAKPGVDSTGSVFYAKQPRQGWKIPDLFATAEKSVFRATNKMKEAVVASEVLEDENMKVDLPIEQMEVREVEEEPNSYNDFKNHQNAAFSTRSSPSRTNKISEYTLSMKESRDLQPNSHGESRDQSLDQQEPKDTKGEEMSSKKYGIRSHTSTFLNEKKKVTLNCGPNGV
ncbi:doublecortin domain-containing protein 2C [Carassius carassius]|uniref:doublecortin domain-containing protein 2C n=1 Tax=Carassius carassius TaxID=217509 RepID=UPI002868611A|nr:doublecortin domain-containing protein 2C [Carassius carassius]XP_059377064.1 doublecortin domain-containing protein 2C [Carassius carassius]